MPRSSGEIQTEIEDYRSRRRREAEEAHTAAWRECQRTQEALLALTDNDPTEELREERDEAWWREHCAEKGIPYVETDH